MKAAPNSSSVNYKLIPVGGCEFELNAGDNVLWAYDAYNMNGALVVDPMAVTESPGSNVTFTVTDGTNGRS